MLGPESVSGILRLGDWDLTRDVLHFLDIQGMLLVPANNLMGYNHSRADVMRFGAEDNEHENSNA